MAWINSTLDSISSQDNINLDDINAIVNHIENLFTSNSKATFGVKKQRKTKTKKKKKKKNNNKPWFNFECHRARNGYHKIRKQYNKYKTDHYKSALKQVSKKYKNKMASNFSRCKNDRIQKLRNLKNARPNEFWKIINSVGKTDRHSAPLEELYAFFKTLNSENIDENSEPYAENFIAEHYEDSINETMNQPFSEAEILSAVKNLKNNKSCGIDSILNEHLKSTIHKMCPIYVKLFNLIYDTGLVPDSWTVGNILPIYKNKGNINLAENYRPITLLSCFGKLFTAILNARLNKYMEEMGGIESCQAGFRKAFSTTDNLFILQSLLELSKVYKNKLHRAFIDFKQAFDTVWRSGLWQKLLDTNVNGKCFRFSQNMYCKIKSRIITSEGTSAFFPMPYRCPAR